MEIESFSAAETENAGALLARELSRQRPDDKWFVCLKGDLGAGKTAFVRGFASVVSPGSRVKSPTYTVVNEYRKGSTPLYHFDLYRLCGDGEDVGEDGLESVGFDEYVAGGHCILEWSEYLPSVPGNAVTVTLTKTGDEQRHIEICDEAEKKC